MKIAVRDYYSVEILGFEVDSDGPPEPPPELRYLWLIEALKALPWPGGIEQQPHVVMKHMIVCIEQRQMIKDIKKRNEELHDQARNVGNGQGPTIKDLIGQWSSGG